MSNNGQYNKSQRNTLSTLNYQFPACGSELMKALLDDIFGQVEMRPDWNEEGKKLRIDVRREPLLLARYQVYMGKNDDGTPAIILEKVDTVYDPKKATEYSYEIKRIPIKEHIVRVKPH